VAGTVNEQVIRAIGDVAEDMLGTGDPARDYAVHLAAHAVAEYTLTGTVGRTLNMNAPCPWCGALPPGTVIGHQGPAPS